MKKERKKHNTKQEKTTLMYGTHKRKKKQQTQRIHGTHTKERNSGRQHKINK